MTENNKTQFLPFNALNEFMRDDYRNSVIQEVFTSFEKLDKEQTIRINRLFAKGVQIPGFRNSSMAPTAVKIRHANSIFEKSAEFVALVVNCWSQLHSPLKEAVYKLLDDKNWKPLPMEADRSLLPGFQVDWPKGDSFVTMIQLLRQNTPDIVETDDNISLMIVWMSNKLPYGLYEEKEPQT
jgi:hypothetical protein